MDRVLVIGAGGSGKTWLSKRIGERTGLPVVHLDSLYWQAGWVPTPDAERRERVAALAAEDRWVMDGNYGGTLALRLAACDSVVFLDIPRSVCIARVIRRWLRYNGRSRPEVAPGCRERLTWGFLVWVWSYQRRRRPDILRQLDALPADRTVRVLRCGRGVAAFLATMSDSTQR